MTEAEWLSCIGPHVMSAALESTGRGSERTYRLFACACLRGIWPLLPKPGCGRVIEAAEQFADRVLGVDGLAGALAAVDFSTRRRGCEAAALRACWDAAFHGPTASRVTRFSYGDFPFCLVSAMNVVHRSRKAAVQDAARKAQRAGESVGDAMRAASEAMSRYQADCLRDVFGNPFRPITLDPARRTPTVVALAQAAYDERSLPAGTLDLGRLAVLADALEDVGCSDEAILNHLRGPGPHVRGCKFVDALLGLS